MTISEILGYCTTIIVLLTTLSTLVVVVIVFFRFGFNKKQEKIGLTLLLVFGTVALISSIIAFPLIWKSLNSNLQVFSLATIFSGIAAILVIIQLTNSPYVYVTPHVNSITSFSYIVVPPNSNHTLTLTIFNDSKVTAHDVIVRVQFPPHITVRNINTPAWTTIVNDGHGAEVHLNSDKSYNPVHPFTTATFDIIFSITELPGVMAIATSTQSRNASRISNTFFMSSEPLTDTKQFQKSLKKSKLPKPIVKETFHLSLRLLTMVFIAVTIVSWVLIIVLK